MDLLEAMRRMVGIRTADERAKAAGLGVEDLRAAPVQAQPTPTSQLIQTGLRNFGAAFQSPTAAPAQPTAVPVSARQMLLDQSLDNIEKGTGALGRINGTPRPFDPEDERLIPPSTLGGVRG